MIKHKTINIFTDGGSRGNPGPAASGVYITDTEGNEIAGFGKTLGITTNNVAEYTAVIEALDWVYNNQDKLGESLKINFFMDSKLVCSQIMGLWKVKHVAMQRLLLVARQKMQKIPAEFSFTHIPREQNKQADSYVNRALDNLL